MNECVDLCMYVYTEICHACIYTYIYIYIFLKTIKNEKPTRNTTSI